MDVARGPSSGPPPRAPAHLRDHLPHASGSGEKFSNRTSHDFPLVTRWSQSCGCSLGFWASHDSTQLTLHQDLERGGTAGGYGIGSDGWKVVTYARRNCSTHGSAARTSLMRIPRISFSLRPVNEKGGNWSGPGDCRAWISSHFLGWVH